MMKRIPWQPSFTWRRLGFITGSSSLAYRQVLEQNSEWDVIMEPALGTVINLEDSSYMGQLSGIPNSAGNSTSANLLDNIYPFNSAAEYLQALSGYSSGALMNVDRMNGWSMDSLAAVTGIQ